MNDLELLGAALTKPEPSADAVDRRRHQLQNSMRGPVRRGRSRRPVIAIGVTAATAAAAVAIAVVPGGESPAPPSTADMSGPQVLLAAATVAETKPPTSGTYWYSKSVAPHSDNYKVVETWTKTDGQMWIRFDGGAVKKTPGRHPLTVRGTDLRFEEIAKLPTSPAELKATLLRHSTAGEQAEVSKETRMLLLLSGLVVGVPAPPKVRAAGLRAMATLPGVKNQGKVPGGQSILFAGEGGGTKMVVDVKTSTVTSEGYADVNGKQESMGAQTTTHEWTDDLPR